MARCGRLSGRTRGEKKESSELGLAPFSRLRTRRTLPGRVSSVSWSVLEVRRCFSRSLLHFSRLYDRSHHPTPTFSFPLPLPFHLPPPVVNSTPDRRRTGRQYKVTVPRPHILLVALLLSSLAVSVTIRANAACCVPTHPSITPPLSHPSSSFGHARDTQAASMGAASNA